jgi:hypothetical protein
LVRFCIAHSEDALYQSGVGGGDAILQTGMTTSGGDMAATRLTIISLTLLGLLACGGEGPQGLQGPQGDQGDQGPAGPSGIDGIKVFKSTSQTTLNTPNVNGTPPVQVVSGQVTLTESSYLWINAEVLLTTADANSKGVCEVSMTGSIPAGTIGDEHRWEFFGPGAGFNQLDLSFDAVSTAPLAAGDYTIYLACGKDLDSAQPVVESNSATLSVMVAQAKPAPFGKSAPEP